MNYKMIRIDGDIHRQVKLAAILSGQTIRDWTEKALRDALPERARMLVDTREPYTVKEETNA